MRITKISVRQELMFALGITDSSQWKDDDLLAYAILIILKSNWKRDEN